MEHNSRKRKCSNVNVFFHSMRDPETTSVEGQSINQ